MTREHVPGLVTSSPLATHLPALYQSDTLALRFADAFDELLAPVSLVLDCLDAYLDPELAPLDFVAWLASWLGVDLDEGRPETWRPLVRLGVGLHRWRGTRHGLEFELHAALGVSPDIVDPGGGAWSEDPQAPPPPKGGDAVIVRLPFGTDVRRATHLVDAATPAHLPRRVEIR